MIRIKLHIPLLHHLIQKDLLNQYSFFLFVKYRFANSLVYNYNPNALRKKIGSNNKTIQKYIAFFLKRGWCSLINNHLKFHRIDKIAEIENIKCKQLVTQQLNNTSKNQIKLHLQRILFSDAIRKQQYIESIKKDLTNPKNLKEYKSARKKAKNLSVSPGPSLFMISNQPSEISFDAITSNANIAKLFNFSSSSAQNLKNKFQKENWFCFIRRYSILAENISCSSAAIVIREIYNKAAFWYNNMILTRIASGVIDWTKVSLL